MRKWNGKVSDFGLSRVDHANMESSFAISNVCGTHGYIAPEYYMNGYLTQKSDVYSFGIVLWEVLCGRHALVSSYTDDRRFLTVLVHKHLKKGTLYSIIPSHLQKQIKLASLLAFAETAFQCLKNAEERPTMKQVVEQLQKALDLQRTSRMSLTIEEVKHLQRIPLQDIRSAVESFDSYGWNKNFLCQVTSEKHGCIAVWRLDRPLGKLEFMREIAKAAERNNGNIVSLLGFCDEGMEKYLVFKDESNTPLDLWWTYELMSWDLKIMHPPPL
ncbi:receptor-like protein kinase ANXUR2 [Bidens hawaiensis]|uniref:receptor-like protein kinase ANXUR2 n=1 Tax=Bidens hawaiensis TaxID=980011 RepID=UPI00404ABB94